jgi:hypothetical protein
MEEGRFAWEGELTNNIERALRASSDKQVRAAAHAFLDDVEWGEMGGWPLRGEVLHKLLSPFPALEQLLMPDAKDDDEATHEFMEQVMSIIRGKCAPAQQPIPAPILPPILAPFSLDNLLNELVTTAATPEAIRASAAHYARELDAGSGRICGSHGRPAHVGGSGGCAAAPQWARGRGRSAIRRGGKGHCKAADQVARPVHCGQQQQSGGQ